MSGKDRCEVCGGPIDDPRLTPDGHPKGPNLVVCTDCETRHLSTVDEQSTVRLLSASKRMGASERGCPIAVKYVVEGEPGEWTDWLDDFIDEHCANVVVGDDGLSRSLRTDDGDGDV